MSLGVTLHCVKSVRIRSFSGRYFSVFGLNTERYGVLTFYAVLESEGCLFDMYKDGL